MAKEHLYKVTLTWTGNKGTGTSAYRAYERSHIISAADKPEIAASSDPAFRGDKHKYNPEELLVASVSSCHMLWFLHLCAEDGIIVTDYIDNPTGIMEETANGSGKFKEIMLHPLVTVTDPHALPKLDELHKRAHTFCFIANSVNFPIKHQSEGKVN